ncbi:MAG: CHAP domain-containing protein [Treponema sp.]|jgi:hypothetical protein|nr:CHAP domain-containing protein [Treponema sp.]
MTLGDFICRYYGKKIDFDGQFGAQCVDLIRQYFRDVWDMSIQPEGVIGAQEFYLNHEQRPIQKVYTERVEYKKGQNIPSGAVVVFGNAGTNKFGHIGICIRAESDIIYLLEQDGFRQDGVKISAWGYNNVLGYLVKKGSV